MKIIEFICNYGDNDINFNPLLVDVLDISSVIKKNDFISTITTKSRESFNVWGSPRSIQSRIVYSLMKKHNYLEDPTIRPSITIIYNISKLEVDTIHMDDIQCYAFLMAYNAIGQIHKIDEYSANLIELAGKTIEEKFLTKQS